MGGWVRRQKECWQTGWSPAALQLRVPSPLPPAPPPTAMTRWKVCREPSASGHTKLTCREGGGRAGKGGGGGAPPPDGPQAAAQPPHAAATAMAHHGKELGQVVLNGRAAQQDAARAVERQQRADRLVALRRLEPAPGRQQAGVQPGGLRGAAAAPSRWHPVKRRNPARNTRKKEGPPVPLVAHQQVHRARQLRGVLALQRADAGQAGTARLPSFRTAAGCPAASIRRGSCVCKMAAGSPSGSPHQRFIRDHHHPEHVAVLEVHYLQGFNTKPRQAGRQAAGWVSEGRRGTPGSAQQARSAGAAGTRRHHRPASALPAPPATCLLLGLGPRRQHHHLEPLRAQPLAGLHRGQQGQRGGQAATRQGHAKPACEPQEQQCCSAAKIHAAHLLLPVVGQGGGRHDHRLAHGGAALRAAGRSTARWRVCSSRGAAPLPGSR